MLQIVLLSLTTTSERGAATTAVQQMHLMDYGQTGNNSYYCHEARRLFGSSAASLERGGVHSCLLNVGQTKKKKICCCCIYPPRREGPCGVLFVLGTAVPGKALESLNERVLVLYRWPGKHAHAEGT